MTFLTAGWEQSGSIVSTHRRLCSENRASRGAEWTIGIVWRASGLASSVWWQVTAVSVWLCVDEQASG